MVWTLALILGVIWALAMISSQTFGGFVHILIVAAAIAVAYQVLTNRRRNREA